MEVHALGLNWIVFGSLYKWMDPCDWLQVVMIIYSHDIFQVLNVKNNKLKALPSAIGNLHTLQTLNLQGNFLLKSVSGAIF